MGVTYIYSMNFKTCDFTRMIEEEAMLLAVFYCCICSALLYFLCHSHSFNLSLGCL